MGKSKPCISQHLPVPFYRLLQRNGKCHGGELGRVILLKEQVASHLNETAKTLSGIDNFCDRIADESIAEDPEALVSFLSEKNHPDLQMEPIM